MQLIKQFSADKAICHLEYSKVSIDYQKFLRTSIDEYYTLSVNGK